MITVGQLACLRRQLLGDSKFSVPWNNSILANKHQRFLSNAKPSIDHQMLNSEDGDQLNQAFYEEVGEKALGQADYFNVKRLVKLQEAFDARVYLGHKEGTLNPYMKPYIFGSRLSHLVIDLDQTVHLLQEAVNFAAHIAFRNGIILFINKSATVISHFNPIIVGSNSLKHLVPRLVTLWKRRPRTA